MTTSATSPDYGVRGFQGSSTTRVKVILYPNANEFAVEIKERDPRRIDALSPLELSGPDERSDVPSVVAVTTENALDGAGGTWQVTLRAAGTYAQTLVRSIEPNDWVDIAFIRQDQEWHVMRGLVDVNSEHLSAVSGATSIDFTLSGRSFVKPMLEAPIWFDPIVGQDAALSALNILRDDSNAAYANPAEFVKTWLFSYYEELVRLGRTKWRLPPGMPGEADSDDWLTAETMYDASGYSDLPPRIAAKLANMGKLNNTTLWQSAREWSDPPLCELFADLSPAVEADRVVQDAGVASDADTDVGITAEVATRARFQNMVPAPIGTARTKIFFRDTPFPSPTRDGSPESSPWFTKIPLFISSLGGVTEMHLSRSDADRVNAFYVAQPALQGLGALSTSLMGALWDDQDVVTAGLRRMDVQSRYVGDPQRSDGFFVPRDYRKILRDFYCLNHLLKSGTIRLGPGRPDIRIGSRFRVLGETPEEDTTGYVERIRHEWSLVSGLRTTVGVSRVWVGTDEDYWKTLTNYVNAYREVQLDSPDSTASEYRVAVANITYAPTAKGGPPPELHYPAKSQKMLDLFKAAAPIAGVPVEWVTSPDFLSLYAHESSGWVGIPTGRLAEKRGFAPYNYSGWVQIQNELKSLPENRQWPEDWVEGDSTATGLGQLLLSNVDLYYPGSTIAERRAGIGDPLSEAVGMLKYIQARYPGGPSEAWAFWQQKRYY